jgi:hypothetical protein
MPNDREQILEANKASVVSRQHRVRIKAAMKAGELDPLEVIRGHSVEEKHVSKWGLEYLLRCVPGIGKQKLWDIMLAFHGKPLTMVGALSDERRLELTRLVQTALEGKEL